MSNLTLGSLFDGSGGFPLGGLLSGITPVWASEIEPFPIRVTTKRLPFMKHYGDISAMDGSKIEPVDIICFGSPCQDMSVAGRRNGLDGSRSCLFYEAIRIIKEMRCATDGKYPKYIVWENVPGAFSSNAGLDFKAVLEAVIGIVEESVTVPMPEKNAWPYADIYMGDRWSIAYRVLDAQFFGVPQRRRRIFLVGSLTDRSAGDILFKSEGMSGYSAESFRTWQRAACCTEGSIGEAGNGIAIVDNAGGKAETYTVSNVSVTIKATNCNHPVSIAAPYLFENHSQDTRYTGPCETSQTVASTFGMGGNNQPFVVETPKTMKERCGKPGGGKGPLFQNNLSGTISTNNDQTLFQPQLWNSSTVAPTLTANNADGGQRMPDKGGFNCVVQAFGVCSKNSNSMKSGNPGSGFYAASTSRTLDSHGGNPTCNQGGVAVVEGNGSRPSHRGDGFAESNVMYTLNTVDRHAVSYGIDRAAFNQGQNALYDFTVEEELEPTMVAKGPGAVAAPTYSANKASFFTSADEELAGALVATDYKDPPLINAVNGTEYIVRRLTPTECSRLQGFPDWWCSALGTEEPDNEELRFWLDVFETHSRVTGDTKPKNLKQVRKWLSDPHTDSAEYKMWGNGVALPCVYFVLSGIVWSAQSGRK